MSNQFNSNSMKSFQKKAGFIEQEPSAATAILECLVGELSIEAEGSDFLDLFLTIGNN